MTELYWGYARASTKDKQENSPERQDAGIRAFVEKVKGRLVTIAWERESASKVPWHERPVFSRLLATIPRGGHLVVWRFDRTDRDAFEMQGCFLSLATHGIIPHILDWENGRPLDLSRGSEDRVRLILAAMLAEVGNAQDSRAKAAGMAHRTAKLQQVYQGSYTEAERFPRLTILEQYVDAGPLRSGGRVPVGVRSIRDERGRHQRYDWDAHDWVCMRWIHSKVQWGRSRREISRMLAERGVKTSGGKAWRPHAVCDAYALYCEWLDKYPNRQAGPAERFEPLSSCQGYASLAGLAPSSC